MTAGLRAAPPARRWRVQGVSVQGHSHLREGVECQDAYRHATIASGHARVLAVADGAGSRARSAEGATLAVGLATAILAERVASGAVPDTPDRWRALLDGAYREVVAAFGRATARMGADAAAFAATLTAVVLAHPWVGVVGIGDGFVITRADGHDGRETFDLVSFSDPAGEYANETVFLSSPGALDSVAIDCLHDPCLTAIMLATDGLAPAALRRDRGRPRPNRSLVQGVFGAADDPTGIARFLLEDRISALSGDDKTLLLAVAE